MTVDAPRVVPRWRRRLRNLWPVPLLVWMGFGTWAAFSSSATPVALFPLTAAAIAWAALAVGGRRGALVSVVLVGVAARDGWFFGWSVDGTTSRFSPDLAAHGLGDAATWHLELLLGLWPIVLLAAVLVAVFARRRGHGGWRSAGGVFLVLAVIALPVDGAWDDGCNGHAGGTPLLTRPWAEPLMDRGVGVIPESTGTLMYCLDVGVRSFKPFWLGGDGLPPEPRVQRPIEGIYEELAHAQQERGWAEFQAARDRASRSERSRRAP